MDFQILTPQSEKDFLDYYHLRWLILRQPWEQPLGSEKDEFDVNAVHKMAVINNNVIATGRLHFINYKKTAQVRYMAVSPEYERHGIGKAIYTALEEAAIKNNIATITLNARESAVDFYKKLGFNVVKKTHLLFNQIQHYEMRKLL